jgi:hypothetical protein
MGTCNYSSANIIFTRQNKSSYELINAMIEILVLQSGKARDNVGSTPDIVSDSKDPDLKLGEDGSVVREPATTSTIVREPVWMPGGERNRSLQPPYDLKTSGRGRDKAPEDSNGAAVASLQEAEGPAPGKNLSRSRGGKSKLAQVLLGIVVLHALMGRCRAFCPHTTYIDRHYCHRCHTDLELANFVYAKRMHYANGSKIPEGTAPNDFRISHVLTKPLNSHGLPRYARFFSYTAETGVNPTSICRNELAAPCGSITKNYRYEAGVLKRHVKVGWHSDYCYSYHLEESGHHLDTIFPDEGMLVHLPRHKFVAVNQTELYAAREEGDIHDQSYEEEEEGNNSSRRIDDEL